MREYTTEEGPIGVDAYQKIRSTTGWASMNDAAVRTALQNDLYSVHVLFNNALVGIGRVIGDGGMYFYIQDVIVVPQHQGKGVGTIIMREIGKFIQQVPHNAFVGLMAADGTEGFYDKFGFEPRSASSPGMFKKR